MMAVVKSRTRAGRLGLVLRVPVRFVAYPGPGHAPADPVRQRDVNRRQVEWLARYLTE